jgi:hypothetical protein
MLDVNIGSMAQGADGALGATFKYQAQFPRAQWYPHDRALDRFFDAFVPAQYEAGFAWRCKMLGGNEAKRAVPFQEQPDSMKTLIAGNAEVLLNLFQGTPHSDLDAMRQAGEVISERAIFDHKNTVLDGLPGWEPMAKAHHDKWLTNFRAALASKKRFDADHSGNREYDELPENEKDILKIQTWGNWRVLAMLTDEEYQLLKSLR